MLSHIAARAYLAFSSIDGRHRLPSCSRVLASVMVVLLSPALQAQDSVPVPGVFDEVIDVRVVNLEVVVTDKDGVRVHGLLPEDFRLLVDGRETPIEYFTEVLGGEAVRREDPAAATLPALAPGEAVGTSYLVFIDEYFTLPSDRNLVVEGLISQLPQLGPGDRMAVVAFDGGQLDMLSSWSQSVPALTRTLTSAKERPTFGLARQAERRTFEIADDGLDGRARLPAITSFGQLTLEEEQLAEIVSSQTQRVVLGAAAALRSFANPPGRKVMLLLSGGWPYNPVQWVTEDSATTAFARGVDDGEVIYKPLVEAANRLSYTLYPVDVPGVGLHQPGADVASVAGAERAVSLGRNREREEEAALTRLAVETGGRALINTASRSALERVVADTRSYYWIGFTPTWKGDDEAHDVRLQARRKGLKVRARGSFSDLSREREVSMMVESALLFGNPPSESPLEASVGRGRRAGIGKVLVPLKLKIPLSELTFVPQAQDLWVAEAELRVAVLDQQGNTSDVPVVPMQIRAPGPPAPGLTKDYEAKVKLRRRPHDLVVSLYDRVSGKILTTRLEVNPG